LPEEEYDALAKFLSPVELPLGMQLSEPNRPVDYVYFLNSGLISTDALTEKGESVEVGVIGREGFSGLPALLGQPQMSHSVLIQGIGEGMRIRSSIVRNEFLKGGVLQQMVHAFTYLQMVQVAQSVLCNRMHEVDARLARWLLTSAGVSGPDARGAAVDSDSCCWGLATRRHDWLQPRQNQHYRPRRADEGRL